MTWARPPQRPTLARMTTPEGVRMTQGVEEREQFRESVRRFVQAELIPREESFDRHGAVSYTHLTLPTN